MKVNNDTLCPLTTLSNLEELYLNQNRFKDLPAVFHCFNKLKIIGSDWFAYIAEPNTLSKVVEDPKIIA